MLTTASHILLTSYLSHIQILPLSLNAASSFSATHTLPLPTGLGATCCTWLSPSSVTENIHLAAGGVDRAVHVFEVPSLDPSSSSSGRELYTLMGHTGPISSIASSSSGQELVSASRDGNLNLYILPEEEPTEHQVPSDPTTYLPGQKRRKKMKEDRGPIEGLTDGDVGTEGWRRVPDVVMRGHKGRVGGVIWDTQDKSRTWSGGWDGSVRGWDVETGACTTTRVSATFNRDVPGPDLPAAGILGQEHSGAGSVVSKWINSDGQHGPDNLPVGYTRRLVVLHLVGTWLILIQPPL